MPRESKILRGEILTSRADGRDIKFLAELDSINPPEGLRPVEWFGKRMDHWDTFVAVNQSPNVGVFVAKHRGLYIGYLAVSTTDLESGQVSQDAMYVRPPYDTTIAAGVLLERANVTVVASPFHPQSQTSINA